MTQASVDFSSEIPQSYYENVYPINPTCDEFHISCRENSTDIPHTSQNVVVLIIALPNLARAELAANAFACVSEISGA